MRIVPFLRGWLAVAGAVLLVTACSGGDDDPPAAEGSATPAAAGSATAGSTAGGSGGATPTVPPAGEANGTGTRSPGPAATATPGTPVAVSPLPPAPVGRGSTVRPGVSIAMTRVADVTVPASGPGEIAGPGVAVTIKVTNTGSGSFDLDGLAINASYGSNVPANPGGSAKATPLRGALAAGRSAEGTYYFLVPAAQAKRVRVEVSSNASPSIAVFVR